MKNKDPDVKNKFHWPWLEEKVNGVAIQTWCRKLEQPGVAFCIVCCQKIMYDSNGKKVLLRHAVDKNQDSRYRLLKENTTIPDASAEVSRTSFVDRVEELRVLVYINYGIMKKIDQNSTKTSATRGSLI